MSKMMIVQSGNVNTASQPVHIQQLDFWHHEHVVEL